MIVITGIYTVFVCPVKPKNTNYLPVFSLLEQVKHGIIPAAIMTTISLSKAYPYSDVLIRNVAAKAIIA